MPHKNREDRLAYLRKYNASRVRNEFDRERQRKRTRLKRAEARSIILDAKDRPCADCNVRYQPWIMQFDHVRGTKEFDISRWVSKHALRNTDRLIAEISKCDVVCANCHADREHNRTGG